MFLSSAISIPHWPVPQRWSLAGGGIQTWRLHEAAREISSAALSDGWRTWGRHAGGGLRRLEEGNNRCALAPTAAGQARYCSKWLGSVVGAQDLQTRCILHRHLARRGLQPTSPCSPRAYRHRSGHSRILSGCFIAARQPLPTTQSLRIRPF